jgi:hypothetical protein
MAREITTYEIFTVSSKLRKKIEMHFVHPKRILGLYRLRLRGPKGGCYEFHLAAAQNLRKLAKLTARSTAPSLACGCAASSAGRRIVEFDFRTGFNEIRATRPDRCRSTQA